MGTAFIYTDAYLDYDYGPTHPLRIIRLKLAYDLIKAYALLDLLSVQFIPTIKAEEKDLAVIHSEEYRLRLKRLYGRRTLENYEEVIPGKMYADNTCYVACQPQGQLHDP